MQQTIIELPVPTRAIDVYSQQSATARIGTHTPTPLHSAGQIEELRNVSEQIGKPRRAIIKALADFHVLTAEQLTRLLFRKTSYTYVNKHLQFLIKAELVETILPAKQTLYGRAPFVYVLTRTGRRKAKHLGFGVSQRYRTLKESTHKSFPVAHILAVNEFLLKMHLLAKNDATIVLRHFVHDKELFATPLTVQIPGAQKTEYLSPDSWLDVVVQRAKQRRRYCYCVELNLTEVKQRRWRETVRKYLYCLPAYKARFATDIITVLVSVQTWTDFPIKPLASLTPSEWDERTAEEQARKRRVKNLLLWTKLEMEAQHRMQSADLFWFSSAPLDQMSSRELFYSPHWVTPLSTTPQSLLLPAGKEADGV